MSNNNKVSSDIVDRALDACRRSLEKGYEETEYEDGSVSEFIELFREDFEEELKKEDGDAIWKKAEPYLVALARAIGVYAGCLAISKRGPSAKVDRRDLWASFSHLAPECKILQQRDLPRPMRTFCDRRLDNPPDWP